MAESYSVKAILSATDSGFSSTLKSAMGLTESFGSKLKSGFNFGILTGAGQQAFSAISSGLSGLVSEIDSSNAAWKTFEGNMKILGKSTGEIDSAKKELQAFAEQTVYSSSDMAQTFAQLEAVGTKNTTQLVKGFGGLAAAAENPQQAMKTLSQQATQMAAKPTVAWADFKLMLEQTPAGMAAVAKHMGMTSAELVTKIQAGEVATEDFFAAIEAVGTSDSFSKLATEYKTVGQAMDGLQETLGNKLTPAFDVLSQVGIKAVSGLADALGTLDGDKIAEKVSGWVKKATPMWESFKKVAGKVGQIVMGVGKKIAPIFQAASTKVGGAIQNILDKLGQMDAKGIVDKISAGIDTAGQYWEAFRSSFDGVWTALVDAFSAVKTSLTELFGEFDGASALESFKTVMTTIANVIKTVAGFIEKHSDTFAKLALAFAGFKVLNTVAPGLTSFGGALIKLAGKGVAGLAGKLFGIAGGAEASGSAAAQSAQQMLALGAATLMVGAGVLLASLGFALLAQSAIALSNAGGGAIAIMFGLAISVAALMVGMLLLVNTLSISTPKLYAAATAMLALGAAVLMIGAGFALLTQSAIALANAGWGAIAVMVGMVAVIALLAVGAAALGTALTAGAIGFIAFGAAIALVGVGALLAGVAIQMVTAALPMLIAYGSQGAIVLMQLASSLTLFAVGAALAGAAALVLGAGLLVVGVAVLVVAAGVLVLSAAFAVAAAALALFSLALPLVAQYGNESALAIATLGVALLGFAAGAALAGAAALILGAGMLTASVGILLCAGGMAVLAASVLIIGTNSLIAAASFQVMGALLPVVTADAVSNAAAMAVLAGGLITLGSAALVAGAGFVTLGAGLIVAAAGVLLLGAALIVLSAGAALAAGAMALVGSALPLVTSNAKQNTAALLQLSTGLLAFAGSAATAGVACLAFGAGMLTAAAGTLAMAGAIVLVSSSMKSIASDAKKAENSLDSMQDSVDIVQSGLDALGDKAKSAMNKLTDAFDKTASKAQDSGKKVGTGFTKGLQGGLKQAPSVARSSVTVVNTALLAGYASAFSAGANISRGFANGMLSKLGVIQSAANRMAAAADKAVRAKAKIHSPSKVSEGLGSYWGEGFVNGIADMARDAWRAAENLVSIPSIATPNLAMAYGGELSSDYNYSNSSEYIIEVPLAVDGKEFARATASYTQDELSRRETRESRKKGRV